MKHQRGYSWIEIMLVIAGIGFVLFMLILSQIDRANPSLLLKYNEWECISMDHSECVQWKRKGYTK